MLLGLVAGAPGKHGIAEDVVEDLVPGAAPVPAGQGSDDALRREGVQDVLELLRRLAGVAAQIADPVGDLRAGRA